MRLVLLTAVLTATSAQAQPALVALSGEVRPRVPWSEDEPGNWARVLGRRVDADTASAADTLVVARIVLTRLRNGTDVMMCVPGPAVCRRPLPLVTPARGSHGRYSFRWVPEGEYRMRVEADGCAPVERTVAVLRHAPSVEHVVLTCTPNR